MEVETYGFQGCVRESLKKKDYILDGFSCGPVAKQKKKFKSFGLV